MLFLLCVVIFVCADCTPCNLSHICFSRQREHDFRCWAAATAQRLLAADQRRTYHVAANERCRILKVQLFTAGRNRQHQRRFEVRSFVVVFWNCYYFRPWAAFRAGIYKNLALVSCSLILFSWLGFFSVFEQINEWMSEWRKELVLFHDHYMFY